jgi:catechol 2,3-dioxygenase-like lactoylglutathione lyase family enzyme
MLDHVSVGVSDLERSRSFYDTILRPLGIVRTADFDRDPGRGGGSDYGMIRGQLGSVEFTITAEAAVAPARGAHLCFRAFSPRRPTPSNLILSQKRADNVMQYMISQGVNPNLVAAQGFGDASPVASNATPEGRAQNRRVELTLANTGS